MVVVGVPKRKVEQVVKKETEDLFSNLVRIDNILKDIIRDEDTRSKDTPYEKGITFSKKDIAQILGVSTSTIGKWVNKGFPAENGVLVPLVSYGKMKRFTVRGLRRWMYASGIICKAGRIGDSARIFYSYISGMRG